MVEMFGILPIDKPVGMTSHDVVDVIRRMYGVKRVGHAGTLDPAASGLLLVMLGRATRVAPYLSGQEKTYIAGVVFGATSTTGDADGEITSTGGTTPDAARVGEILDELKGEIELPVPAYAAVRSEGKRRYELARAGKVVPEMMRRSVVRSIEVLEQLQESLLLRVRCASGTYIRSLAERIGQEAGCGAYLVSLRRESIGNARVEGAYGLDYLAARASLGEELPAPEAIDGYLEMPVIEVAADAYTVIHHGQPLIPAMVKRVIGEFAAGASVAISVEGYGVAAIGKALVESKNVDPIRHDGSILSYQCVLI